MTTQYVFTNRRIITRAGVVSKKGRDMPLAKVNNVSFEIGVLGRILNYGRLEVTSASDENLVIDDVPNVEVIQRDVYRLHEQDDDRRRQRSSEQGGDPVPPGDGT
ncbi:MAG: PH domain-containing protein [Candidatus Nanopelagicales bacterium]